MMGWLADVFISLFAKPLVELVLGLFGYDTNWDPRDGRRMTGWRLAFSAISCFLISVVVLGALFYLAFVGW